MAKNIVNAKLTSLYYTRPLDIFHSKHAIGGTTMSDILAKVQVRSTGTDRYRF